MKMLLQSNQSSLLLALAVISLSSLGAGKLSAEQDPRAPRAEDQKIGTRIVNFFKDVVYGEQPSNRYRGYGPHAPAQRPQPEKRYSLDAPPMAEPRRSYTPSPAPMPEPQEREREPVQPRREVADAPKPKPQRDRDVTESEVPKKPVRKEEPAPVSTRKPEPKVNPPAVEESPPAEKEKPAPVMKEESPPPSVVEKTSPPTPEPPKSFMGPSTSTPASTPSTDTTATSTPSPSSSPMVGSKTSTPGRVKSPYAPFNELDVTGLPSGSLAMDPTTQKVFRVP